MKLKKVICIVIACCGVCIIGGGIRFARHEKWLTNSIHDLQQTVLEQASMIEALSEKVDDNKLRIVKLNSMLPEDAQDFLQNCDSEHYNMLFIGNSITRHGYADYWWSDDRGMASTSVDTDYVHVVANRMADMQNLPVNAYAFNYSIWETQASDRAETFPVIKPYLNSNLDIVVIQLGENASNLTTFQDDYEELVKYVKNNARNARIILVGNFWTNVEQEKMKKMVAKTLQIPYADLSAIQNDSTYQAGLGTMVEGADGVQHEIEHEGVATHPGDKGMLWIAERIFECI